MTTWVLATTNCATNGRNKRRFSILLPLIALLLAPAFLSAAADDVLNLYVDVLRFPLEDGKTHVEINYEIPYTSLSFGPTQVDSSHALGFVGTAYMATVKVDIDIKKGEEYKRLDNFCFTNQIVTRDINATMRPTKFYIDKISLDLRGPLVMRLSFTDSQSGKSMVWEKQLEVLPPEETISDLELCNGIAWNTTGYMEKFKRGDVLYHVRPDRIFTALECDTLYVYAQYMADSDVEGVTPQLTISGTVQETRVFPSMRLKAGINEVVTSFPLEDVSEGFYNIKLSLMQGGQPLAERMGWFIRRENSTNALRLFKSMDDEKVLLSYFVPSSQMKSWDDLTNAGKVNFLDRFWRMNDPNPNTPENELYVMVQERIRFADEQYSKYVSGWQTDRGRVYIRNGAPDEIYKDTTSGSAPMNEDEDATPLSASGLMGARDYQIWKYYSTGEKKVYLFFDKQSSGALKLIYVDGDSMEQGDPSWEYYMGSNFDETELNN